MITVHAGLHKTGSTAIQMRLAQGNLITNRRYRLYQRPKEDASDDPLEDAVADRVRRVANRTHVIISDEGFFGSIHDVYSHLAPRARRLHELYADSEIRVIVYLRPHLEWARSAVIQLIKFGCPEHPDSTARQFLAQPYFSWTRLVEDLAEQVGPERLIIRPYQPAMDAAQDFFAHCGLGAIARDTNAWAYNRSIDATHAALMSALNHRMSGYDVDLVRTVLESDAARSMRPPTTILSRDVEQEIWEHYHSDWQNLLRTLPYATTSSVTQFAELAQRVRWNETPHVPPSLADSRVLADSVRLEALMASWPRTLPQKGSRKLRHWRTSQRRLSDVLRDSSRRLLRRR